MTDEWRSVHEAAWPDMFQSLQEAYAELSTTEQELARRASKMRATRDLFAQVIESMSESLFLLEVSGIVSRTNPAAGRLLGVDAESLEGEPFSRVCGNPEIPSTPWELARAREEGRDVAGFDAEIETRDGDRVPILASCSEVVDESGGVRGVLVVLRDMTERRAAQDRVRSSLRQKELLLQELHHRVKNNLQLVSSLLRMQIRSQEQPEVRSALQDSRNRIVALARLHELLYRSGEMGAVDFSAYTRTLTRGIVGALGAENVRLQVEAGQVSVPLDTAIPCGLIVNELVTNTLEHAFPGDRSGVVRIRVGRTDDGGMEIVVSDDGVGLDDDEVPADRGTLGSKLVRSLVRQIDGELAVEDGPGTTVRITVPSSAMTREETAEGEGDEKGWPTPAPAPD